MHKHITGFQALPDHYDFVHHVDIFFCAQKALDTFPTIATCSTFSSVLGPNPGCHRLAFAYDKGASYYQFPGETGMSVGSYTDTPVIVMQIHYLAPLERLQETVQDNTKLLLTFDDVMKVRALWTQTDQSLGRYAIPDPCAMSTPVSALHWRSHQLQTEDSGTDRKLHV
jgi:hypothetical protein